MLKYAKYMADHFKHLVNSSVIKIHIFPKFDGNPSTIYPANIQARIKTLPLPTCGEGNLHHIPSNCQLKSKHQVNITYRASYSNVNRMRFCRDWQHDNVNMHSEKQQLTCFLCIMKYSEWYMWLLSGSSIQIQNGSPVFPCARSFHLKLPRIFSTTRSTVRVIGWMDASTSSCGIWLIQSLTRAPMLMCRIMWPTHDTEKCPKNVNLNMLLHN